MFAPDQRSEDSSTTEQKEKASHFNEMFLTGNITLQWASNISLWNALPRSRSGFVSVELLGTKKQEQTPLALKQN